MHRQNREFASQVPMQNYLVQNGAIACLIVQFYSGECGFTLVSALSPSILHPGALTIAQGDHGRDKHFKIRGNVSRRF